jgi:hypothetical protein
VPEIISTALQNYDIQDLSDIMTNELKLLFLTIIVGKKIDELSNQYI